MLFLACNKLTAASPSLPVHQSQSVSSRAQDSSFQAGLSLTFPLGTIEEIELSCMNELNWTELNDTETKYTGFSSSLHARIIVRLPATQNLFTYLLIYLLAFLTVETLDNGVIISRREQHNATDDGYQRPVSSRSSIKRSSWVRQSDVGGRRRSGRSNAV